MVSETACHTYCLSVLYSLCALYAAISFAFWLGSFKRVRTPFAIFPNRV